LNKKEIILEASQRLFSQFGVKKVTTDDISLEAKVSKATVYNYFKNKFEIFREVVFLETNFMLDLIRDAVDQEKTIERKFKAILKTKIHKIHSLINFYRVTRETWGDHWPYIEEMHQYFMSEERKIIRDIMVIGNKSGILNVEDVDLQAHVFTISLKSLEYPWSLDGYEKDVDKVVDLIVDTFLNGVRVNRMQKNVSDQEV